VTAPADPDRPACQLDCLARSWCLATGGDSSSPPSHAISAQLLAGVAGLAGMAVSLAAGSAAANGGTARVLDQDWLGSVSERRTVRRAERFDQACPQTVPLAAFCAPSTAVVARPRTGIWGQDLRTSWARPGTLRRLPRAETGDPARCPVCSERSQEYSNGFKIPHHLDAASAIWQMFRLGPGATIRA